ncbi:MAG: response regulator transcription factor [Clostridia bacterium]
MRNGMAHVLIVEDDAQIRNFLSYALQAEGFEVLTATAAQEGLQLLICEMVDLMLLDLGLPDFDGMDVIRKVRQWSEVPIIVLSARDQDREKADALDAAADDYLTKPFSDRELMARIRVALRHLYQQSAGRGVSTLQAGELKLDLEKHLVYLKEEELHMTPMEYSLLSLLFRNAGKVLTSTFIIREIWGVGYGTDTQALRALMAGLRRKIEENPAKPRYLLTEIGVGYRLAEQ